MPRGSTSAKKKASSSKRKKKRSTKKPQTPLSLSSEAAAPVPDVFLHPHLYRNGAAFTAATPVDEHGNSLLNHAAALVTAACFDGLQLHTGGMDGVMRSYSPLDGSLLREAALPVSLPEGESGGGGGGGGGGEYSNVFPFTALASNTDYFLGGASTGRFNQASVVPIITYRSYQTLTHSSSIPSFLTLPYITLPYSLAC
jgi:hypothetical protein